MNATTSAAVMSPGTYMRKRREAAGFSIDEIAMMVGGKSATGRAEIKNLVERLEAGEVGQAQSLVYQLVGAFSFDERVYSALVLRAADPDSRVPIPPICRVCACSFFDPCHDLQGEACGWAPVGEGEEPLCTMCIDDGEPDSGEQQPIPAADNDAEACNAA